MKRYQKRSDWADQIALWLQSGKSAKAWCRENNLVYNTFLGWHYRLNNCPASKLRQDNLAAIPPQFIELKDSHQPQPSSGVSLEYGYFCPSRQKCKISVMEV